MNAHEPKILCIDDDSNTSDWIKIMMRQAKISSNVTTVKTGRDAFKLLNNDSFDLCVLDYALPDLTGVQLCRLMRQMGCEVPILFFSAMSRPVDREKAMSAGADEYLCKPDDFDIFADAVKSLLNRRRPIYAKNFQGAPMARAA